MVGGGGRIPGGGPTITVGGGGRGFPRVGGGNIVALGLRGGSAFLFTYYIYCYYYYLSSSFFCSSYFWGR